MGLLLGTATVAALFMIATIAVLESINRRASNTAQATQQTRLLLGEFELGMIDEEAGLRGYALTGSPEFLRTYQDGMDQVARAQAALDRAQLDSAGRGRLARLESTARAWQSWAQTRRAAGVSGAVSQPDLDAGGKLFDEYRSADNGFAGYLERRAGEELQDAKRSGAVIGLATPALSALILVMLLLLGGLVFRSILRPIRGLAVAARSIARGEAVVIPPPERHDELGNLAEALSAWQAESGKRLGLSQAMAEVNSHVQLDEVLEMGVRRASEVLAADQVAVLLAVAGRFEVSREGGRSTVDSITAWIEMAPAVQATLSGSPTIGDFRDEEWQAPTRGWAAARNFGPVLSVPMVSRGVTVGALSAIRLGDRAPFEEADAQVAQIISGPLAAAVHVARLFGEKEKQAKTLAILNETARAASGILDPVALARVVSEKAGELLGGQYATLSWYDPNDGLLHVMAENRPHAPNRAYGRGEGAAGKAFQTGEAVIVEDYQTWSQAIPWAAKRGLRGVIAVPLLASDRPVGALSAYTEKAHRFTQEDAQLLALLAAEVAPALEAASLHAQLRRANEELRRVSHHKSQFLANMSHELRTPLNAILGFSELLMDEGEKGGDGRKRLNYLSHIHSSGKHLLGLINEILDLAKIEAGQVELHLVPFHLGGTIAAAIETVEPLAAQKQIQIGQETIWSGTLFADEAKVRQMLLNLLSNAIKFTPDGGSVRVGTREEDGHLVLTVADTGIGIAREHQERIFEEFEQLESGKEMQHPGTGLGLALTRRLAELHGGRVWVESELGVGSRFHVALPLNASSSDTAEVSSAAAPDGQPLVLVVEDNLSAAALLSSTLRRGGYRVEVVRDGREAPKKARDLRPLAITLDILLPGIDGWEVLRALKSSDDTRDIPVLVVSVVDNRSLGIALGADDYLLKPVDRKALLEALGRYARRGARARQLTVLAIDDEPTALDELQDELAPAVQVLRANGGAEGIERARAELPDLVLLDLVMEEVTGFDVVAALKADPRTRDIPILVLTARDLTDGDKTRLKGRVEAVLAKGQVGTRELLRRLKQLKEGPVAQTRSPRAASQIGS